MKKFLRNMRPVAPEPYHYRECGLDDVYLLNGFTIEQDPEFGELLSIEDAHDLHELITWNLVSADERLRGPEILYLRKEFDLTQAKLATLLDVNVQTVARWEKGESAISGPANRLFRIYSLTLYFAARITVEEASEIFGAIQSRISGMDGNANFALAMLDQPNADTSLDAWKLQLAA